MTVVWFIVWLIANNIGGLAPLQLDPVNFWTATLIAAIALDLAGSHAAQMGGRTSPPARSRDPETGSSR